METAQAWIAEWQTRLDREHSRLPASWSAAIAQWLVGDQPTEISHMDEARQVIARKSQEFCYSILKQRYLNVSPDAAYRRLIRRLSNLVLLRNKIRTWVALSRDRHRSTIDVVQDIVQEMLHSDRYLQRQIAWIADCTEDRRLRNVLIITCVEEYCLRPIRNQPLLVYRFVNYLRRSQRGGVTQVPSSNTIRLVSAEVSIGSEGDDDVNLIDTQTLDAYEHDREFAEVQMLRLAVEQNFRQYLAEHVSELASSWVELYLKGYTQDEIATQLNVPIAQIYRLREKISYHAIRVFALKQAPELVSSWLKISLQEHRLGLTPEEWTQFYSHLDNHQRDVLTRLQAGRTPESIAEEFALKTTQIVLDWSKLYLLAQKIRNSSSVAAS
jgi:uncharacterized protein (DUF433 family)